MQIRNNKELITNENTKLSNQEIIRKNLKKYIVSKNRYNRYMINHIIYRRRKTIVSRFKDHLIMDDIGEFLKRFYKFKESVNRIPKIGEYYQTFSFFSPVYLNFEFSLTYILRKYYKRKKKYLEYIEDLKDNLIEKKNNDNNNDNNIDNKNKDFELVIKPELVESIITKDNKSETLELTEYNSIENKDKNLSKIIKDLSSSNEYKNKKELLKEKIKHLKQTKKILEKKFHLNLKKEKKRPSLLLKSEKKNKSNYQNEKIIKTEEGKSESKKLKLTKKITGLKLSFNNLYKRNLNNKKNHNNPFLSLTERLIPTKSDDLIKEKLGWLKKSKIKIKTSQFIDSIINKNYSNTSRNQNRVHLVIKQISSQQYSSRTNSNESKFFGTSDSNLKKKIKIKLNINNYKSYKKSRNSFGNMNKFYSNKKILLTENNSRYPSVIRTHNSSEKYYNIIEKHYRDKKKSFIKKKPIKIENIKNLKKNQKK